MTPHTSPLFEGCATALVTPFRNGSLDKTAFLRLLRRQIESGIDALVVAGTTGESPTLTDAEKRWLFTATVRETAAAGLIASLANSIATFNMVKDMDQRGKVVNIAFAVSAAFVFGDHLGFTAGFAPEMLPAVIVGKLVGGVSAVAVAMWMTRKNA